jgi:curved DNA-binding protein
MSTTQTRDYYQVLGINRTASEDEIKAAYRKLARKFHPDLNPGDKAAEDRFKELQEAYDVLSDPDKRKKYNQYGENWRMAGEGFTPPPGWEGFRTGQSTANYDFSGFDFGENFRGFSSGPRTGGMGDIFEELFGRAREHSHRSSRGQDVEATLELSLEEAHRGGRRSLQLQATETCSTCNGRGVISGNQICSTCSGSGYLIRPKTIEVNIPVGVNHGATLRLAGQGGMGMGNAQAGDLYLNIHIKPHPIFSSKGSDLEVEIPIAPWEAALGTRIDVPTIDGQVEMSIPAGTQSGQRLRLRNQGMNKKHGGRGDLYVRVKIVVPKMISEHEQRLYEELKRISNFNPRAEHHAAKGGR